MKPGDRVEARRFDEASASYRVAQGTVTRIREHGWGDNCTVWVHLDNGDAMPYAPEELRLIEGENA